MRNNASGFALADDLQWFGLQLDVISGCCCAEPFMVRLDGLAQPKPESTGGRTSLVSTRSSLTPAARPPAGFQQADLLGVVLAHQQFL
jgi:hypothetical protein